MLPILCVAGSSSQKLLRPCSCADFRKLPEKAPEESAKFKDMHFKAGMQGFEICIVLCGMCSSC